ncbi:hypothetical protein A1O3_03824 [Capronia epimyces CBS 606.96]|uniref:Uncharacterized protein n=1 Tax=Capronia epimyces CBS 606.96 TaxID=1182542 RepID=W9YB71_9EURO|nr:uncharacterized protein A1O3_03824 [Capronia epimyces CBS 606.96]EXJ86870.1 hypothetical protein A1O3_03824 [Capronia epimyces CBS 606.96]
MSVSPTSDSASAPALAPEKASRRWYDWFAPEDSPEERKLILKLDLLIVPFAFIGYWLKYVDQANLSE